MDINKIKLKLKNQDFSKSIIFFDKIDSTSTYCKNNFNLLGDKAIIIANEQSSGKGKSNRVWTSPKGGLYFSILLKSDLPPLNHSKLLPLLTSVAILEALESFKINVDIKWPNDLLIHNKKLCGILVESKVSSAGLSYIIIGIGLNINSTLPVGNNDLNTTFVSLKELYNIDFSLEDILSTIINNVDNLLLKLKNEEIDYILDIYRKNCILIDKEVLLYNNNEERMVKILDISTDGSLKILYNNEIDFIESGEFSISKDFLK